MTTDGSVYERFRRALTAGRLLQDMAEAKDITRMPLSDALDLCLLLESNDDPRYERAAARYPVGDRGVLDEAGFRPIGRGGSVRTVLSGMASLMASSVMLSLRDAPPSPRG